MSSLGLRCVTIWEDEVSTLVKHEHEHMLRPVKSGEGLYWLQPAAR